MLNHTLYQIEEFSDIWADACLRDSEGRLMFLSVYGRDGVLMQMLAAFELGASQRGVNQIHLVGRDGERHRVDVGDVKRLDKHAGKLPRQNLFGPLNQMWLFDRGMRSPDRANRIGWALHSSSAARRSAALNVVGVLMVGTAITASSSIQRSTMRPVNSGDRRATKTRESRLVSWCIGYSRPPTVARYWHSTDCVMP